MPLGSSHPLRACCLVLCAALVLGGMAGCGPKRITGLGEVSQPSATSSALGLKVARTAATQIGRPYRSGGETPKKGFDCSGLIYWSFRQNGVKVPRVTTEQMRMGQPVPRNRLQPGDIVVFRASSGPNGLHTGIYAGQGKFIHSPNSRSKVRMDSLSTPYWKKTFLTARRVVNPLAGR